MGQLLSVEEAEARILEHARPLATERVSSEAVLGRVLAEPARAAIDLPPFPSSAMDGFALRALDAPGRLPIVHRIAAGRPSPRELRSGEAMAIATGGVVPEGADAVVPIEYVVAHDNEVDVPVAVPAGTNVRPRGGDVRRGDVVVEAGVPLGPAQIGALAAAGIAGVVCARRPRAAVLATGTELRPPGAELGPGQIYEANGPMLAAQLARAGAAAERLAVVEDDERAVRAALERGLAFDVLVTSGGVSVGPHDLVRQTAAELGAQEVFWGVAVKPGKPVSFAVRGSALLFGLPGNPVSSLVGFELFVRPALLALQGASEPRPRLEPGVVTRPLRRNAHRDELVRARIVVREDEVELEPVRGQDSHMIVRAAAADALVLVPRGEGEIHPGSAVRFLRL